MNLENLKRAQFIQRFSVIIAGYFFIRAIVQVLWIKESAIEHITNYLIIVILHSLILQIVKAERVEKINKLLPIEVVMFAAGFVLFTLEFLIR